MACQLFYYLYFKFKEFINVAKDQCVTECDKNKNELISTLGNTCVEKCGDKEFINKDGDKCVKKCEDVEKISLSQNQCLDTCPADSTANSDTKVCECEKPKLFINVAGDMCLDECPNGEFAPKVV